MYISVIFLVACILSLCINWILIKFSINLGVRNLSKEDEIRWQSRKPSVGGLAFYLVFLILYSIISNIVIHSALGQFVFQFQRDVSLLIALTAGFFVGLIDDAKNTNPLLKFLGQIFCGLILVYFGVIIPISPNLIWNGICTVIWTVFLMNSINMLDNMDGLTSLVSFIIIIGMVTFGFTQPFQTVSILMSIVTAGILIGFLVYNWHPSKIYMGDSGSQFLGIALAHLSIVFIWNQRVTHGGYFQVNQFFLPLMMFTIPIFDTATVFIHRLLRRQSPFVGGKDHLSHHLVYMGLKDSQAVTILAVINALYLFIGLMIDRFYPQYILPTMILWLCSFGIVQLFYSRIKR